MTVAELLSYKSFNNFMALEYGYAPNELLDLSTSDLYAYMVEWYNSPFFPAGVNRERIRTVIEDDKQISVGRKCKKLP